jgi:hypothetical protein
VPDDIGMDRVLRLEVVRSRRRRQRHDLDDALTVGRVGRLSDDAHVDDGIGKARRVAQAIPTPDPSPVGTSPDQRGRRDESLSAPPTTPANSLAEAWDSRSCR